MGLTTATIKLSNPRKAGLKSIQAKALADTGAYYLSIPQHVCDELELEIAEYKQVTLADGSHRKVPYVGPVQLNFANRTGFTGALVMGNQVLVGAIPMEDMDLVVRPLTQTLEVNPENVEVAGAIAYTTLPASTPHSQHTTP